MLNENLIEIISQQQLLVMIKKILLLSSLMIMNNFAHADDWTGKDKEQHFIAGAVAASLFTTYKRNEFQGFIFGTAIGLGKEIYDATTGRGDPSIKDFIVTSLGAAAGAKVTGFFIIPKKDGVSFNYAKQF